MGKLGVVVVAAGKGTRMGTAESKQYLLLEGKPILVHTLEIFERMAEVESVVLVTGPQDIDRCRSWITEYGLGKIKAVLPGGAERQHSVYKGLCGLDTEWVAVHDGVRPFVKPEHILHCWEAAERFGAAVLAVPAKDTIKIVDSEGIIRATPDRKSLWAIHTPQVFRLSELLEAHEQAEKAGFLGTDDAMLVERLGREVHVVEGDYTNVKITTPDDLEWGEFLLKRQKEGKR